METKVIQRFSEQSGTKIILSPKYNHYKQNWHFLKKKGIQFVFTNVGLKLTSKIPVSQSASRPVSQSDEKKRDVIRYRVVESDGGGGGGVASVLDDQPLFSFYWKKLDFHHDQTSCWAKHFWKEIFLLTMTSDSEAIL